MDLIEALRTTGAAREFTDEPVSDEVVAGLLDTARFAPSGGNRQGWRVAVVKSAQARSEMAALMQPIWNEYLARNRGAGAPFNVVEHAPTPTEIRHVASPLIDDLITVPVVLAVAVDLSLVAMVDTNLERPPMTGGGSVYPFCWSILLAARAHGLSGVMTTFLSRAEASAAPLLGLPSGHALVATIMLGHPVKQITKLKRNPVASFATIDRFDGPQFGS